ncbi:MAG: epoxyqueuosine reductase QueH [Synergistaceae bacterium]|jgi:predicted adenine nucleotide alpha hydrolase (AANH) superfamily ATPase|nr:epoxyqueuosine reductase QueH [Synergistaceae bacterium]
MRRRAALHVCCAPDATVPWPALREEGYDVAGFFYGSNIHPMREWLARAEAARKLAGALSVECEAGPYEPDAWFDLTRGYESAPEGGGRCARCFRAQLMAAAEFAAKRGAGFLCTTLTISPHKNPAVINEIGESCAASLGLVWINRVWRKGGGYKLSVARSRKMNLYRQNYCGCLYSTRRAEEPAAHASY